MATRRLILRFLRSEFGGSAVEYALFASFIILFIFSLAAVTKTVTGDLLGPISNALE